MTNQAILTNTNHTHSWYAKSRDAIGRLTVHINSNTQKPHAINLKTPSDYNTNTTTTGKSTGNLIPNTTNDDAGIDTNSKVTFTASTSANYYISAGSFNERTGTYTLSATATGHTNSGAITNNAYLYDANGNMTQNNNKSIQWTSFNKPKKFQKAGDTTTFTYAPDRSRYQKVQTSTTNNTLITTTYIGKLYEQIKQNTSIEHKYFIYADDQLIAIYTKAQSADILNDSSNNNNAIRIFLTSANGASITINRPNTKVSIDGSSGNDSIYVSAGIISASRFNATEGHDKIYLAGNFADYKQNRNGSGYTFSRGSGNNLEQITFQLSDGDKLYFADGSIALDWDLHTNTTHPTTYKDFTQNDLNPNETSPSTFPTNNSNDYTIQQNAPSKTRYLHYDNLGSIDTITNGQGNIVERMAYTAFGQRRQGDWRAADPHLPIIPKLTNRGFTGHEHIDEMGFIHMNGRVYDPSIGRFLSADSAVPYIYKSQSYNRYAYTRNNPLKYKDPSGYYDYDGEWDFWGDDDDYSNFDALGDPDAFYDGNCDFDQEGEPITSNNIYVKGDNGHGEINNYNINTFEIVEKSGNLSTGFFASTDSSYFNPSTPLNSDSVTSIGNTARSAVVGNNISVIGKGKFVDGAETEAFKYLFDAENIDSTFSNRETVVERTKMKYIDFQPDASPLLGDILSTIIPSSFFVVQGNALYNRIDTLRDYNVYYRKTGYASAVEFHRTPIGQPYQVRNIGSPQPGYDYIGNGIYTRRSNSIQDSFQIDLKKTYE